MAFDANLLMRAASAGNLSASELTPAGIDMGGPDLVPVTYQVHVPSAGGTTPTLDIKIQESDDNNIWRDYLVIPQINAAGEYYVTGKSNARYRRYTATLGGTTPNFGAVVIAPVPAGRYTNW
jgi:hypothetical protein